MQIRPNTCSIDINAKTVIIKHCDFPHFASCPASCTFYPGATPHLHQTKYFQCMWECIRHGQSRIVCYMCERATPDIDGPVLWTLSGAHMRKNGFKDTLTYSLFQTPGRMAWWNGDTILAAPKEIVSHVLHHLIGSSDRPLRRPPIKLFKMNIGRLRSVVDRSALKLDHMSLCFIVKTLSQGIESW